MGYIYKIYNDVNDTLYIGQTVQPLKRRFQQHIYDASRHNYALYNAMNKYGADKFHIEMIEKCDNGILNEREIYWIQYYDTYHNGYNCTLGGESGRRYDRDFIFELWENGMETSEIHDKYGIEYSLLTYIFHDHPECIEERKRRSSEDKSKRRSQPVSQYDLNGRFIQSFNSVREAAIYLGDENKAGVIRGCCEGRKLSAHGFLWRYGINENDIEPRKENMKKPVSQYDLKGNYITTYDSVADAARAIGKFEGRACISVCANNNGQNTAFGYLWRYTTSTENIEPVKQYPNIREVCQYDLDGNYITTFKSLTEASMSICGTSKNVSHISDCAQGKQKFAYGFIWRFLEDNENKINLLGGDI